MEAIILAGGLGTRLRGVVSDRPKSMAAVNEKPFLELLIERLDRNGIDSIVLALGYMGNSIENYFKDNSIIEADIRYSYEEKPLGTAGAIKNAEVHMDEEDFFVLNGDTFLDISYLDMMKFHIKKKALVTIALRASNDISRYGSVDAGGDGRIHGFAEKGKCSGNGFINAGIYIMNKSALGFLNNGECCSLEKEFFPMLISRGMDVFGYSTEGYFIDIGIPEDYARFISDLNKGVIK